MGTYFPSSFGMFNLSKWSNLRPKSYHCPLLRDWAMEHASLWRWKKRISSNASELILEIGGFQAFCRRWIRSVRGKWKKDISIGVVFHHGIRGLISRKVELQGVSKYISFTISGCVLVKHSTSVCVFVSSDIHPYSIDIIHMCLCIPVYPCPTWLYPYSTNGQTVLHDSVEGPTNKSKHAFITYSNFYVR